MAMARFQTDQLFCLAGWRRLVRLVFLLPAISDLLLRENDTSILISTKKESTSFYPTVYGITPDYNNYNNNLSRCQQNLHPVMSNNNESHGNYSGGNEDCDKSVEWTRKNKSKRRRAIAMIRSIRKSIGCSIICNGEYSRRKKKFKDNRPKSSRRNHSISWRRQP